MLEEMDLRKKILKALRIKDKINFKTKFYLKKENTVNFLIDNYNIPFIKSNLYSRKLELVSDF